MIYYQPSFRGLADGVNFYSHITLGHELFHELDIITKQHGKDNPIMNHNPLSESLNATYRAKSAELFRGNENRLYLESRAVAYENLLRSVDQGNLKSFRNIYAPFSDIPRFTSWIIEAQLRVFNSTLPNFISQ
jgi:hypothetical protein